MLAIPEHTIRIITRDVGGGFAAKGTVYAEEAIVAYFALKLRTSACWTETRSESLCAMIAGVPGRSLTFKQVAQAAHAGQGLSPGQEPGLWARRNYRAAGQASPFGTHVAVVEVHLETGQVSIIRYLAVDSCQAAPWITPCHAQPTSQPTSWHTP